MFLLPTAEVRVVVRPNDVSSVRSGPPGLEQTHAARPLARSICQPWSMANTAMLRYKVEPVIREMLKATFGQGFSSQILTLLGGATREFDAVSSDGRIVASIKSSSGLTSGGKFPGGKVNGCIADLYYLSLLRVPVRQLILTNPEFFAIFTKRMRGAVAPGIDVVLLPLPAELQAEVDAIVLAASEEIDKGKATHVVAAAVEEEADSNELLPSATSGPGHIGAAD